MPNFPRPIIITDAAINIAPTLEDKHNIIQNAMIWLTPSTSPNRRSPFCRRWRRSPTRFPQRWKRSALCKMADRGQITGGILDGPLAFDNAIDERAARTKGHRFAGGRKSGHPGGARSGSRQHVGRSN
ncbi:MAG: hypothetical protein R3F36_07390 [Candidatus Competibacteraceae bacterium]